MKKTIIVAATALTLLSAAAYAHMHQPGSSGVQHERGSAGPGMQHHMQGGMMQGGMMHGGMHGGGMHGGGGTHGGQPKGDNGPSSLAFHGANAKMHGAMDITYTGNADVDFVKGMIPHHAGAVDMAKIVVAFGKDPEVKKLAEGIIAAQEREIAFMQEWLKKNAK